jgi:hypothetical protein
MFPLFVRVSEVNIITGVLFTSTKQFYKMTYLRLRVKINMARHHMPDVQFFSDALCSLILSEPAYVE